MPTYDPDALSEMLVPPPQLAPRPTPHAFSVPEPGDAERPEWWPDVVEFRGILPDSTQYKVEDDPAYAHLTEISRSPAKARKGIRVFRRGLHPNTWLHPNSPLQRQRGAKARKAAAEQRGDTETSSARGSEREFEAEKLTTRALSRQFANATPEQLRAITDQVMKLAARGDQAALSFVIRMETMLAKSPLDDGKKDETETESLRLAREEVIALAEKQSARLPEGVCPWCYRGP